jgi:glycosyltransferase involved in cell wall biosynthesis
VRSVIVPKLTPVRPLRGRPRVSVVVPCYNYGDFLPQCVDSLVSQRSVHVEILIVDDASPDGSGDVADALAAVYQSVSVIRHRRNMGHIATYNEGLDAVAGEYSVLISADDMLPLGALARATALLEENPAVGLAYGHPVNFTGSVPPPGRQSAHSWLIWPGADWIRAQCRRGLNCIYSPESVMRTSVQKKIGGFRNNLPHSADLELWLRFAAVSDIGRVNGADQAFRRVHGASMMQSTYATLLPDLKERRKAYESFFELNEAPVEGLHRSLAIVRRRLAEESIEYASSLLEAGSSMRSSVTDLISFAQETYPKFTALRAWNEYMLLTRKDEPRGTVGLRQRGYARQRNISDRLRFRRWQWMGV